MSVRHNPKIVTDGLVFYHDMENKVSYKGPAISNLFRKLDVSPNYSGTGYAAVPGEEMVYIPTLGRQTVSYTHFYNDYPTVSSNCCPRIYRYSDYGGDGFAVTPSTTYTYAILYKVESGYTNSNYMYRYEYASNGAYVTEGGVHTTSKRIHLGDGWYWAWNTFTTNAATNWIGVAGLYYYRYSTIPDKVSVAKILLTPGDYTSLHPKYWPDVNTTRTNLEAVSDLTNKNNGIEIGNISYSTDGKYSFDGTNDFIRFPENSELNVQNPTIEVWVKPNTLTQNGFWFEKGNVNTQYSLFQEGSNIQWRTHNGSTYITLSLSSSNLSTTNYSQVVATIEGDFKRIYVNGVLKTSIAWTSTIPTNANGCSIGAFGGYNGGRSYYYNGNIGAVKVYNRAFSAEDVLQNFNALRGRYGI